MFNGSGYKTPNNKTPKNKTLNSTKRPIQQNAQLQNAQCYKTPKATKNQNKKTAQIPKNNKNR